MPGIKNCCSFKWQILQEKLCLYLSWIFSTTLTSFSGYPLKLHLVGKRQVSAKENCEEQIIWADEISTSMLLIQSVLTDSLLGAKLWRMNLELMGIWVPKRIARCISPARLHLDLPRLHILPDAVFFLLSVLYKHRPLLDLLGRKQSKLYHRKVWRGKTYAGTWGFTLWYKHMLDSFADINFSFLEKANIYSFTRSTFKINK